MIGEPRGKLVQFVYDVHDLIDQGKAPPLFKKGPGGYELDIKSKRIAEIHGTAPKNQRGEVRTRATNEPMTRLVPLAILAHVSSPLMPTPSMPV